MDSYKTLFKPSVEKDIRSIPPVIIKRIMKKIESLNTQLHPPHSVKLEGAERLYRLKVGNYRVVYEIDKVKKLILIHHIRHRREVYRRI